MIVLKKVIHIFISEILSPFFHFMDGNPTSSVTRLVDLAFQRPADRIPYWGPLCRAAALARAVHRNVIDPR